MNTRGLMELVVLTIGYEMGILTPSVFVILVLMGHHLYDNTVGLIHQILLPSA